MFVGVGQDVVVVYMDLAPDLSLGESSLESASAVLTIGTIADTELPEGGMTFPKELHGLLGSWSYSSASSSSTSAEKDNIPSIIVIATVLVRLIVIQPRLIFIR